MEPHSHGIPSFPIEHDAGDAGQEREPIFDLAFREIRDFQFGMTITDQGQPHDSIRLAVRFHHQGRFDPPREQRQHPGHAVSDIVGGGIQITRESELDGDGRQAFPTTGSQGAEPFDSAKRVFENGGDIRFDQLRIGTLRGEFERLAGSKMTEERFQEL